MNLSLNFSLRALNADDESFLWEMLYQALFVPTGAPPFPREVLLHPDISRYVEAWGRAGDDGFIAISEYSNEPVGAAWIRVWKGQNRGYGFVDEHTPELTIAVTPAYRGKGIGQALMQRLLSEAQLSHRVVSLSVSAENPALRLYQRLGFETLEQNDSSITMIKKF